jgi:hypothetical protein
VRRRLKNGSHAATPRSVTAGLMMTAKYPPLCAVLPAVSGSAEAAQIWRY